MFKIAVWEESVLLRLPFERTVCVFKIAVWEEKSMCFRLPFGSKSRLF